MKSILYFLLVFLFAPILAFSQTFTTNGSKVIDPCGNEFIIRGVNYSLADDWNFPGNLNNGKELSKEIIKANPNTVRIQWYQDYGQANRPALTLASLDSVISRFARAGIVSMVQLHDFTYTHTDTTAFNTYGLTWWTSQPVLDLIDKHKSHFILNIANEFGPAYYPGPNFIFNPNYSAQLIPWKTHIKNVIKKLRSVGIDVPIVVDGPNYALDYSAIVASGAEFVSVDPLNRVILSSHAYWTGNTSQMNTIVDQLAAVNFPVVLGEVGSRDATCATVVPFEDILNRAQLKSIGWLAWTWNRDICPERNMTSNDTNPNSLTDGLFSTLTTFGLHIVNSPTTGLSTQATKADFACLTSSESFPISVFNVYPNPTKDWVQILNNVNENDVQVKVFDLAGKLLLDKVVSTQESSISLQEFVPGIYVFECRSANLFERFKVIKK